jgi:hypothetical protein
MLCMMQNVKGRQREVPLEVRRMGFAMCWRRAEEGARAEMHAISR